MPRKHSHNSFTLGGKRKMSRAEVRMRQSQAAPAMTCEHCGEGEAVKKIATTQHGELLLCFCCRRAHAIERARMGGNL